MEMENCIQSADSWQREVTSYHTILPSVHQEPTRPISSPLIQ